MREEREFVDVVGDGRRPELFAFGGPFVTIENDVDRAAVENLREHFPLPSDELAPHAELRGEILGQLELEAGELVVGALVDIRSAAASVAAPAERAALADFGERVSAGEAGCNDG